MLLIHPPVTLPSEPPPGLAKLAGALREHGVPCRLIDANLEGIMALLREGRQAFAPPPDTWTRRAVRGLDDSVAAIRNRAIAANPGRYRRAVMDINRVLAKSVRRDTVAMSLANYRDRQLSPVKSGDLLRAAEKPEENPFYAYFAARLSAALEADTPPAVGFSLNYLGQAVCTFAMLGYLKRHHPRLPLVLGGGLVTSWMKRPGWRNPFAGLVDLMIAGPGERRLLDALGIRCGKEHHLPSYDGFDHSSYLSPGRVLPYGASRGCYWRRCSFCPEAAEGNPYRALTGKLMADDLEELVRRTQPDVIHFLDNALSPDALASLVAHPPGVPWYGFVRATRHLADVEFCRALREAGCVMLQMGLESGDQGVLDNLGKGIDLQEASRALQTAGKAGITMYVYLLFGTPAETAREARNTLDFTVRHRDEISFLNLAIFNLPEFGPEAQALSTVPFYEGDLSLYRRFAHPRGWERHLVRAFLEKEFKRHPAVAAIVRRDPPIFSSNHAAFFAGAMGSDAAGRRRALTR